MYYIIQENTFKEENYNTIIVAIERLGLEYEIVQVLPFTDELIFKTLRNDVFVFGGLKLSRICKNYSWNPACLINKNHDYEVYRKYYGNNLLNYDSSIHRFNDTSSIEWNTDQKFIRPCEDNKAFNGNIFSECEWNDYVYYTLHNGHTTVLNKDTRIQVSTPKKIYKEIRFWVVDGVVVTGSIYKIGYRVISDEMYDIDAFRFCQSMVDIFQLAVAFVMDVCLTVDGWKIVECGCINHAGFYKADMQKVIIALESYYS